MSELETYLGLMYDYANPTADQVNWKDVFHVLSRIARFGGHTSRPYSVGEHVLLVEELVESYGGTVEQRLAALHHDSHEVYLGDWPTPLKNELKERAPGVYESLRDAADQVILAKLALPADAFDDPIIKKADAIALRVEAADLKSTHGLTPYWGQTELPREILDFRINDKSPDPDRIKKKIGDRHEELLSNVPAAQPT